MTPKTFDIVTLKGSDTPALLCRRTSKRITIQTGGQQEESTPDEIGRVLYRISIEYGRKSPHTGLRDWYVYLTPEKGEKVKVAVSKQLAAKLEKVIGWVSWKKHAKSIIYVHCFKKGLLGKLVAA